jgi:hypothetical protein
MIVENGRHSMPPPDLINHAIEYRMGRDAGEGEE